VQLRGLAVPILIRFTDILKHRLGEIHAAFQQAITQHQYQGRYRCVYPIKVNQQRQVVEEVLNFGAQYGFGLEAGSKPELLAVAALATNDTPIICNGFKDFEFIEMAMLAQKIGRQIIPVVEKYTELELILEYAEKVGVRPNRSACASSWPPAVGTLAVVRRLPLEVRAHGHRDPPRLRRAEEARHGGLLQAAALPPGQPDHQHPHIKNALNEAARVYCDLAKAGAGLQYLDVGGGLGVDYDGSQTNFESSMNYTLQEYANDVVYHIQTCATKRAWPTRHRVRERARGVRLPQRAGLQRAGHHGLRTRTIPAKAPNDFEQPLVDLLETYHSVTARNLLESYHDAQQALDMAMNLFSGGYLPLEQRSTGREPVLGHLPQDQQAGARAGRRARGPGRHSTELLSDTYFCNFSLFQSMPDSWAIKQLFPGHAHPPPEREPPVNHAVIGDITCDSDGKIDQFIDRRDVKKTLLLHPFERGRLPGDPGRPAQPVRRHPAPTTSRARF
jgi:arginine decarboxylase